MTFAYPDRKTASTSPNRAFALVGIFVLAFCLMSAPAKGGTYDVVACKGGPDNSWAPAADPGMAAYDLCPNSPNNMISGIIARASVGSGAVGYLQGAYQIFAAPGGASLAGMGFDVAIARWETFWTVGFVAFDGNFNQGSLPWGCYAGAAGCGIVPHWFTGPYWIDLGGHSQVRIESRCVNAGGCTLASTGQYPYTRATIAIANVTVRVQDYTPPSLSWTGGGLLSDGWVKGVQGVIFDASDNVGIRETHLYVDGNEVGARGKPCDYTLRVPCPQGGDSYGLDTATIRPDGTHTLAALVVDTAGNASQISHTIRVDNRAPPQPQEVAVEGGEGWRSRNGFRLTWRNPADPDGSPLTGANYLICPAGGGDCLGGAQDLADPGSANIRVPEAGEYVARVWLRDAAGNEDQRTAGPSVVLRFDDEAPDLAFDDVDAADPTRVSVRTSDRVSGVARGEVELRRLGLAAWHPLGTQLQGDRLVAHVDDETLPDGTYEFRARAVDRAGNERSTELRASGARMEMALPIRIKTAIRAGVPRRSKRGRVRLLGRAHVAFGRRVRVSGRLTDRSGAPLTDAQVLVFQVPRQDGAKFSPLATLRTSGSGGFSYLAAPGPSRTLLLRYPGTTTIRPSSSEVSLLVPAASTFRVSRHFALNGETVTFRGRLRGRPVPASGKLVELQAHVRGHWRTFATTTADARGVWSYAYRFDGTRGRQVYTFRARVPHEATYPYEIGRSGRVRVTVVGL
jgi:hypothetical protein